MRRKGSEMRLLEYLPWQGLKSEAADSLGASQVDLGNGRFLNAEDVLDGHFHRIARATVPVQVRSDLTAAITVLAPALTPLTNLAEEVAQTVPLVQPTAHFRHQLHQALEQTHRQQSAQRILGTRPPASSKSTPWPIFVLFVLTAVVLLGYLGYRQQRRARVV